MFVEQLRHAVEASSHAELPARMAHPLLPFPRPAPRRSRSNRRPFTPSLPAGPYRLPRDVRDRLTAALVPFRNRDAAFALATFLGRFWSTPNRLLTAFPIDRRGLAEHAALGLTEARVRGAIRTLEEVGFLDRALASGSTHRPTPEGLHRKPILFMFGGDYGLLFGAANRRAAAARERRSGSRRSSGPAAARQLSTELPAARPLNSPKSKESEASKVIMGEIWPKPPEPALQNSALEAALDRWTMAFEGSQRDYGSVAPSLHRKRQGTTVVNR
jgi:hypothetical protein